MNKKNIVLFVGAGASASFGKPTTSRLRDILKSKYGEGIRSGFLLILRSKLKVYLSIDLSQPQDPIKKSKRC
jgi:hypothetical protein